MIWSSLPSSVGFSSVSQKPKNQFILWSNTLSPTMWGWSFLQLCAVHDVRYKRRSLRQDLKYSFTLIDSHIFAATCNLLSLNIMCALMIMNIFK